MDFNKRKIEIRNILFKFYVRADKLKEDDWNDEATDLALLVSELSKYNSSKVLRQVYFSYLKETFPNDSFTDFELLSARIVEALWNK